MLRWSLGVYLLGTNISEMRKEKVGLRQRENCKAGLTKSQSVRQGIYAFSFSISRPVGCPKKGMIMGEATPYSWSRPWRTLIVGSYVVPTLPTAGQQILPAREIWMVILWVFHIGKFINVLWNWVNIVLKKKDNKYWMFLWYRLDIKSD